MSKGDHCLHVLFEMRPKTENRSQNIRVTPDQYLLASLQVWAALIVQLIKFAVFYNSQAGTVLTARINETDRNDARGIVQMMRVGLYRPVHMMTLRTQKLRVLLTHRKTSGEERPSCSVATSAPRLHR